MQKVGDGLGASGESTPFETTAPGKVWILLAGTFSSGTTTIEYSADDGSTWNTLTVDGTDQTFSSGTLEQYELPGGIRIRVDAGTGGSPALDVYADGDHIRWDLDKA